MCCQKSYKTLIVFTANYVLCCLRRFSFVISSLVVDELDVVLVSLLLLVGLDVESVDVTLSLLVSVVIIGVVLFVNR